jgi:hypothetical protein
MVFEGTYSQKWKKDRKEIVITLGGTNFLGELGGRNQIGSDGIMDFDLPSTSLVGGLGYRYKLYKKIAVKGNLYFGYLKGDDKLTDEPFRNNRGLNFRSMIIELSGQVEYLIFKAREGHRYNLKGIKGWKNIHTEFYGFVGVGGFYFNSKANYNGDWYSLKKLNTEGQGLTPTRKEYSSFQVCIPYGLGVKFAIDRKWSVGIEYGIRKTWTDYIDDVSTTYYNPEELTQNGGPAAALCGNPSDPNGPLYSSTAPGQQRGDPRDKDSYMFGTITVFYKIPKGFNLPKF